MVRAMSRVFCWVGLGLPGSGADLASAQCISRPSTFEHRFRWVLLNRHLECVPCRHQHRPWGDVISASLFGHGDIGEPLGAANGGFRSEVKNALLYPTIVVLHRVLHFAR